MVRRQDYGLTVNQLLLIGDIVDEDWSKSNYEEEKKELELTIAFATIDFCVSLQGKEVPPIRIEGLNMFWKENRKHCIPHMMMTLKGIFKGEDNLWWHFVPLPDQTKSCIPKINWISRILYRRFELEKQEKGFFFARDNRRKEINGDYDPMFRNFLDQ